MTMASPSGRMPTAASASTSATGCRRGLSRAGHSALTVTVEDLEGLTDALTGTSHPLCNVISLPSIDGALCGRGRGRCGVDLRVRRVCCGRSQRSASRAVWTRSSVRLRITAGSRAMLDGQGARLAKLLARHTARPRRRSPRRPASRGERGAGLEGACGHGRRVPSLRRGVGEGRRQRRARRSVRGWRCAGLTRRSAMRSWRRPGSWSRRPSLRPLRSSLGACETSCDAWMVTTAPRSSLDRRRRPVCGTGPIPCRAWGRSGWRSIPSATRSSSPVTTRWWRRSSPSRCQRDVRSTLPEAGVPSGDGLRRVARR